MRYEPNPKHKEPWQRGRRGSPCPAFEREMVVKLLRGSVVEGGKRYACHEGRAYCAREHAEGRWHGYPVGWKEVPTSLSRKWREEGLVRRSDIRKHWEGHQ